MIERRNLLLGIAAAGTIGAAGCIDSVSDGQESLSTGGTDGPRFIERWLPSSSAAADSDGLPTMYVNIEDVRNAEDALPERVSNDLRSFASTEHRFANLSATIDDVDEVLVADAGRTAVLGGSFDADAIASDLESVEGDELYEYGGYTVYRTEERSRLSVWEMAVDSTTVLQTTPEDVGAGRHGETDESETDEPPAIERLIDTGRGERDRLPDVDDDVAALLEAVDSPSFLQWATFSDPQEGLPEGAVGTITSWSIDGSEITARLALLFADEAAAEEEAVRDVIEEGGMLERYDDVTYESADRLVSVEATIRTEEFNFFRNPEDETTSPQAGIQFDHRDETVVVTVTSIDRLDELSIRRDGEVVEVLEDPSVGDSVELEVSSGETITAVGSVEGGQSAVIGTYDA